MKKYIHTSIFTLLLSLSSIIGFTLYNGEAYALTLTPHLNSDVAALFNGSVSTIDFYDFGAPGDDGYVGSGYIPGKPGTLAEDLYFYFYWIDVFPASPESVSSIAIDFPGLVTSLDISSIDGDVSGDESGYCVDCQPFPGQTPSSSSYSGSTLEFSFSPFLSPGTYSLPFTAVSSLAPSLVTVSLQGSTSMAFSTAYAPVPEPNTFILLGNGLLGIIMLSRKWVKIR